MSFRSTTENTIFEINKIESKCLRMRISSNLSILTNFGCSSNCNFCISGSQLSKNDYKFKLQDARDIKDFDEIMSLIKDNERVQFLPSGDYNTYYNLRDNKVYSRFKDIKWN